MKSSLISNKVEDERAKLDIKCDKLERERTTMKRENEDLQQEIDFLHGSQGERINELDMKFQLLSQEHQLIKEENIALQNSEKELNRQLSLTEKSRDLFREELLELK